MPLLEGKINLFSNSLDALIRFSKLSVKYFFDLSIDDFLSLADIISDSWISFGNYFPESEISMNRIENTAVDAREKLVMILCILRDSENPVPVSRLTSFLQHEVEMLQREIDQTPIVHLNAVASDVNSDSPNSGEFCW